MHLIGRPKLNSLWNRNAAIDVWLRAWISEVSYAHWKRPADVNTQFPNVSQNKADLFAFQVGDSNMKIETQIAYTRGIVLINNLISSEDNDGN